MKYIVLCDFDRFRNCYMLDVETLVISKCNSACDSSEVSGFVKRFLWGQKVIFYRNMEGQFILIGGRLETLDYRLEIKIRRYGFLSLYDVKIGEIMESFVEFRFLSYFSSVFDPLYDDYEDELHDFGAFLKRTALEYPDRYGLN